MSGPHVAAAHDRLREENERLRQALAGDQRRYRDVFESAPDASFVTDRAGRIHEANRAAELLLGVPRQQLANEPLADHLGPGEAFEAALREAGRTRLAERELVARRRDSREVPVGVTAGPVPEAAGEPTDIRWILRDISERRWAAEEVRRLNAELEERVAERTEDLAAANRAKDVLLEELERRSRVEREFITNVAHELRTPVSAIVGAVEVLEAGARDDPAARDRFLAHVRDQSRRLQRLTYALLVLARAEMGQEPVHLEPLELGPLLRDVVEAIALPRGRAVELRCPEGLRVLGHRELVEQAILNVAENAAKHGGGEGVRIDARTDDRAVVIEVGDSRPGMSAAERTRAFQRFYRGADADLGGFGLGLAIASQAVESLGGQIEIDSAPEAGTTVRMTLPEAAGP
jgi:PAS domain S-box-containing protein